MGFPLLSPGDAADRHRVAGGDIELDRQEKVALGNTEKALSAG